MRNFVFGALLLFCAGSLGVTGCASTPLVYAEMTEEQRQDEADLQAKIERTATPIARLGMNLLQDKAQRKELAGKILPLLEDIVKVLSSKNASDWQKVLIDNTVQHLKLLTPDIQDIAQDAFDLLNGWINVPGLNDVIPDVIRDRLLAFIRGAIAGLQSIRAEE